MTAPATGVVRVAIVGNSVPILVVPPRPNREEGTYGEQLERLLVTSGVPARVENHARLFELIHEGGPRFRHELVGLFPDVLVIHYGILELQPNVVPTGIVRHLTRTEHGGRGLRGLWMRRGVPVVWSGVRSYQRWASARAGMRTWRLPPKRFAAELEHVVRVARSAHVLVLVVDVHRPNDRLEHFLPGIGRRWERFQDELRRTVDGFSRDPHVRLVEASAVADKLGLDRATADGLHLTAEAHGLLAERLAEEIVEWRREDP